MLQLLAIITNNSVLCHRASGGPMPGCYMQFVVLIHLGLLDVCEHEIHDALWLYMLSNFDLEILQLYYL